MGIDVQPVWPCSASFAGTRWRHISQGLVSDSYAAKMHIGHDQKDDHSHEHDGSLQGIGVHDPSQAAPDHIGGYDDRIDQQCDVEVDGQGGFHEPRCPYEHNRGIKGHAKEDHQSAEPLDEFAVKPLAKKLGEGHGIQVVAHLPGALAIDYKGQEDAHEDVEESEPQQPHAEETGRASEAHNGRGADKGGSIAHGHDVGVGLSAGHQVAFGVLRLFPGPITQVKSGQQVNQDNDVEKKKIHSNHNPSSFFCISSSLSSQAASSEISTASSSPPLFQLAMPYTTHKTMLNIQRR